MTIIIIIIIMIIIIIIDLSCFIPGYDAIGKGRSKNGGSAQCCWQVVHFWKFRAMDLVGSSTSLI